MKYLEYLQKLTMDIEMGLGDSKGIGARAKKSLLEGMKTAKQISTRKWLRK